MAGYALILDDRAVNWPFDLQPAVGQVLAADAHWWETVAFIVTGRRWGEEAAYVVTAVDGDCVYAELVQR